ncbi:MAG: ribosomal protein L13e [Candidatus Bathyarchaeota archaeon]|jgi:nucleotidyltransferase/DNA polymerase involved in DNA repair
MMKEEPKPIVQARTSQGHKVREGRGFSLEEIKRASLTLQEIKRQRIPFDKRRRTSHPQNIQTLKKRFRKIIPITDIKGIGKVAEEELQRADILDANDLAQVNIEILAGKVTHSKKTLRKWQNEAKKLLKKK